MNIAFTGTQLGMTAVQRQAVARTMANLFAEATDAVRFGHGDCIGADAEFHALAAYLMSKNPRVAIEAFPCTVVGKRAYSPGVQLAVIHPPKEPMARNKDLAVWAHVLIAAPKDPAGETIRSGTWSTVRRARKAGCRIFIVRRSGTIQEEVSYGR